MCVCVFVGVGVYCMSVCDLFTHANRSQAPYDHLADKGKTMAGFVPGFVPGFILIKAVSSSSPLAVLPCLPSVKQYLSLLLRLDYGPAIYCCACEPPKSPKYSPGTLG